MRAYASLADEGRSLRLMLTNRGGASNVSRVSIDLRGFDPEPRALVKAKLQQLKSGGKTLLITSHSLADIEEICDHMLVLHQGRVYIVNDNDDKSYLIALDKKTGKVIWQVDRDEKSNWATPFIWDNGKRTEIITPGTGKVRSYDLDGKLLWEFKGMSSISIPTPFTKFGFLYIASGYVGDQNRPVYVIKPGAQGDITLPKGEKSSEFVAWYLPQGGPYNPSPLVLGDIYYTLYDRGLFTAHDARTGAEIYGKQRIDPAVTAFTSSPWAYNGKVFALSEDGDTFVIEAGPQFKVIRKNALDEMCMATPAIADGNLVIRTAGNLVCVRKSAAAAR